MGRYLGSLTRVGCCLLVTTLAIGATACKAIGEEYLRFLGASGAGSSSDPTHEDIDVDDGPVVMPVLRYRQHVEMEEFDPGEGIELHVDVSSSFAKGEFRPEIPAGKTTRVGGQNLSGALSGSLTIAEVSIAADIHQVQTDWSSTSFVFGLGFNRSELEVRSATVAASDERNAIGPIIGGVGRAQLSDSIQVYIRGTLLLLPARSSSIQIESGLAFGVREHLDLLLGYRYWNYHHDHGPAEYDVDLHGLMLGMAVEF